MYKMKIVLRNVIIFTMCLLPCMSVQAGTMNPSTGDTAGQYMWVFIVVAAVALVAVIITAIMGKKGGK